jgi:hypothetical protein
LWVGVGVLGCFFIPNISHQGASAECVSSRENFAVKTLIQYRTEESTKVRLVGEA